MKIIKSSWVLLASVLVISSCSTSRVAEVDKNTNAKIEMDDSCMSDQDCVVIKDGCCGCNQGGKQQVVSAAQAKTMLEALNNQCGETMCIQVISTDASCSKQAVCLDKSCVLQ